MGFFDRLMNTVANNVGNAVANAAAEKFINPAIDKATDNIKIKAAEKFAEAEDAIYNTPPTFTKDKENNNILAIASRDKLYFMDKVPGGEPKKVMLKFLSTLKFDVATYGSYEGNTDAANSIHAATVEAAQQVFDECAAKHMTMAGALESMKVLSVQIKEKIAPTLASYGIDNAQFLVTYVIPSNTTTDAAAAAPVADFKPAAWTCAYCGSSNTGKFCSTCGAAKE